MDSKRIGSLLARLRKEQNMTQAELSQMLHVSPQAVSKWERGIGCPDIGLLQRLAEIYGVSMAQMLRGEVTPGMPESGNMKRLKFYVCPDCGNILTAMGGELHCCGRKLEPLAAKAADEAHGVTVEAVEDEWYVTFCHPMGKGHYIRFAAVVGIERFLMVRLYPEQGGEFRIPRIGRGRLYLCCSRDGLFEAKL
ncbi:MAG: helix-turn-helix domain-containing protein [Oscillibacter sp.]|nr:helix-turn-helix domain-containing protein [Oscillibacter sp.]